jgi:CrcB protein
MKTLTQHLIEYLAIGGAGFLGAIARYFVATLSGRFFGTRFPIGTMIINISGSFILGWFMTRVQERVVVSDAVRLAVAVGFVGAYTTFSTLMYESSALFEDGSGNKAVFNLLGSLALGLLAVRAGVVLGRRF